MPKYGSFGLAAAPSIALAYAVLQKARMITGIVNAHHEATLRFIVQGPLGQAREIEAILDTGFTGFLSLPSAQIASLGLTWRGYAQAILADGSCHLFDVYAATVIWNGQARIVETDAADTDPLVGMGLIYGYDLRVQVIEGGKVTIEALP